MTAGRLIIMLSCMILVACSGGYSPPKTILGLNEVRRSVSSKLVIEGQMESPAPTSSKILLSDAAQRWLTSEGHVLVVGASQSYNRTNILCWAGQASSLRQALLSFARRYGTVSMGGNVSVRSVENPGLDFQVNKELSVEKFVLKLNDVPIRPGDIVKISYVF